MTASVRRNFKLIIEYDGTAFHGWQRQKEERTIQAEIEKAVATMTGQAVTLIGAGRTDAGVHALGQAANFHCDTGLGAAVFQRGLNSLLPEDIVIHQCTEVDASFHARFQARSKVYQYRILNREIRAAVGRGYFWFIRRKLDLAAMSAAAGCLIGRHDFKAFEGAGSPRAGTVRQVMRARWRETEPNHPVFEIEADGFLRFMVRNLVGTLVKVGHGTISADEFKRILLSADRKQAGPTAPPQGLFLMQVNY